MLDIKFIQENPEAVQLAAKNKRVDLSLDDFLTLYAKRNTVQQELDEQRSLLRKESEKINAAATDEKGALVKKAKTLKTKISSLEKEFKKYDREYTDTLLRIPNIPTEDTPIGKDDSENVVIRKVGKPTEMSFPPKHHEDIGKALGILDKDSAARIAGSRFAYIKKELALLEFAIIHYVFGILTNEKSLAKIFKRAGLSISPKPFIPVLPPVFVRTEVFTAMGRLEPREDKYELPEDNQFLVGSAEHTLGPLHMNETLSEEALPIRYVGFSTCFRREAGTYGKDMKGMIRMHQFDKIEMETFTTKEKGVEEQQALVAIQEHIMSELELPYQVVSICTGDMGKPDAKQMDIEVYMPGMGKYLETHSADYMSDFQARRLKTFVKTKDSKELVHMNDATVVAFSRILAAILENYQTEKGTVRIPKVLKPFMYGIKEIKHD